MNQEMIQNYIQFINQKFSKEFSKNFLLTFLIFFVVIVSQLVIAEVVAVIDSIPIFNSIMELVGIYAVGTFVYNNMLTHEKRNNLLKQIEGTYQQIVGNQDNKA
jgi:CAAD domains of cyanobacterial aminoacyl-tRNA synthetase